MDFLDLTFVSRRELNPTYLDYLIDYNIYPDITYEWITLTDDRLEELLDYHGAPQVIDVLDDDYITIACKHNMPSALRRLIGKHKIDMFAIDNAVRSGNVELVNILEEYYEINSIGNVNYITTPEMLDWAINKGLVDNREAEWAAASVNHRDIIFSQKQPDRISISNIIENGHYDTLIELDKAGKVKYRTMYLADAAKSGNPDIYFYIKSKLKDYERFGVPSLMINSAIMGGSPVIMEDMVNIFGFPDLRVLNLQTSPEIYFRFLADRDFNIYYLRQAIRSSRHDTTKIVADLIYNKGIFPTIEDLDYAATNNKLEIVQLIMGRLGRQRILGLENLEIALILTP